MKNWSQWSSWSPGAFRDQFVKDIKSIAEGNQIKWVFNKSEKLDRLTLKKHIIEALDNKDFYSKMYQILRNSDTQNVIEGFGRNIDNTDSFIREIQEDDFLNYLFEVID